MLKCGFICPLCEPLVWLLLQWWAPILSKAVFTCLWYYKLNIWFFLKLCFAILVEFFVYWVKLPSFFPPGKVKLCMLLKYANLQANTQTWCCPGRSPHGDFFFFPLNQAGALILFLSLITEILKLVCSFSPFLTHFQQENRSQDKRLMLV